MSFELCNKPAAPGVSGLVVFTLKENGSLMIILDVTGAGHFPVLVFVLTLDGSFVVVHVS